MPTRQNVARQRYNFSSALSHVVDAVELDNENDARERAQRKVQQQPRSRSGPENDHTGHTTDRASDMLLLQNLNRPADETLESIELVREPSGNLVAGASETSTQRTYQSQVYEP